MKKLLEVLLSSKVLRQVLLLKKVLNSYAEHPSENFSPYFNLCGFNTKEFTIKPSNEHKKECFKLIQYFEQYFKTSQLDGKERIFKFDAANNKFVALNIKYPPKSIVKTLQKTQLFNEQNSILDKLDSIFQKLNSISSDSNFPAFLSLFYVLLSTNEKKKQNLILIKLNSIFNKLNSIMRES